MTTVVDYHSERSWHFLDLWTKKLSAASSFHSRFYGWPPGSGEIRHGKGEMANFIRMLESR